MLSSPYINRFIQPDSLIPDPSNPQAWNRFSYVLDNPINYSDPSGHCYTGAVLDTIACIGLLLIFSSLSDTPQNYSQEETAARADTFYVGTSLVTTSASIKNPLLEKVFDTISCVVDVQNCIATWSITGQIPSQHAAQNEVTTMPARDIRWTQDTVTWTTGNGIPLDVLADDMASNGWRGNPLRLIDYEGRIYSYDNRRLAAAKLADIDVPVVISEPWEGWMGHYTTKNFGESVEIVTKRPDKGGEFLGVTIFKNGSIQMK